MLPVAAALVLGAGQAPAVLVAHWTFDADGTDSSGSSYDTTLHGGAAINGSGGRIGGALALDGVNDFASTHTGTSSTWDGITGSNARSISLWINADGGAQATTPNDILVGWGGVDNTARNRYDFGLGNSNDSKLRSEINSSSAESSTATINLRDGLWHHVTLSYAAAATSVSFFVDGTLYQTVTYSATPVATTDVNLGVYLGTGVREGSGSNGLAIQTAQNGNALRFWQGLIDDAGIWNSAITAADAALINGLGRIGDNDLSVLGTAATLWGGLVDDTAVINGATWQKVTGLGGVLGDWSQVGGANGIGSFIVLDGSGAGIQIIPEPGAALFGALGLLALLRRRR